LVITSGYVRDEMVLDNFATSTIRGTAPSGSTIWLVVEQMADDGTWTTVAVLPSVQSAADETWELVVDTPSLGLDPSREYELKFVCDYPGAAASAIVTCNHGVTMWCIDVEFSYSLSDDGVCDEWRVSPGVGSIVAPAHRLHRLRRPLLRRRRTRPVRFV